MKIKQNYYEEKISEIKKLIPLDLNKAINLVDEELEMPYIPEKYETIFNGLRETIYVNLAKSSTKKVLNDVQVIDYLWSPDNIKRAMAIDALQTRNIRTFSNQLKKFIEITKDKASRAFLYEIMVEQELNIDLFINKIHINPLKNGSIFSNEEVKRTIAIFENELYKDPNLLETINFEFNHYLLKIFPILPVDGEELAKNFCIAIKHLFNPVKEINDKQKKILDILNG